MTIRDLIFKGKAITTNTGKTFSVKCYDPLQKLNGEHIPPNEGVWAATDAGAIIRDIISNSGHNLKAGGPSVTGVIIDEIDLTDKSRLMAIKLLMSIVNGDPEVATYHLYTKVDEIIFAPVPEYLNDEPAITLNEDDLVKDSVKRTADGLSYFNCATCIGEDSDGNEIRGYYPGELTPNKDMIPDWPVNPVHKVISSHKKSLKSVSVCYQVARGFIKSHNEVPEQITVGVISPDRFDLFPGQEAFVDAFKLGVYGSYRMSNINWSISGGNNRSMSLTLSKIHPKNLSDVLI